MTSGACFASLTIVHRIAGRTRLRYRLKSGQSLPALALEQMPGVRSLRINPAAHSLIVHHNASVTAEKLCQALLALPEPAYQPRSPLAVTGQASAQERALLISALNLLSSGIQPPSLRLPLSLAAALPFLADSVRQWRQEGLNSHVLEGMAVAISLARQDYSAASMTLFLVELGEYLEESIARRSDELLKHLLRPASTLVWVERDGLETQIPNAEVRVGDRVVIGTGAVIPVDGTVLTGMATVNEAAMTGESLPVSKERGGTVLSGTLLEEGRLVVYAEQVGTQTAAARIAEYVAQSLAVKSQAQLDASRLADRLVPSILGLAGTAYLLSGTWRSAASVLQADYSCALKLATPVAFKSAMYVAGQSGILVKGGVALERLAEADTFVFDKTGTLTRGELVVTDSIVFDHAYTPEDLICLAASVEEHYFHPMALAVVAAAQATGAHRHFDHQEVEFIVAHGVASSINGKRIVVGSRHFVEEDEAISVHDHDPIINRLRQEGKTLLYIGFGGKLLGLLALQDEVRQESAACLQRLRRLGVRKIVMLTGDHQDRAAELARQLGLDDFHADLLPTDKARILAELRQSGHRVAFVGDGINDAPALAGAHVGIAMQKGADIARLTADIALLEDNIERVADARYLAAATLKRINANYRMTIGLNTGILAAAAMGLLSPVSTAILHNSATIGILLNALRKPPRSALRRPL